MILKRLHPLIWILLLALGMRLINIDGRSLWYDEAFAVLFSEKGLDAMLYGTLEPVAGGASDIHPLLYYSTLNVWMTVFGQAAWILRLWSVLLGLATITVIYQIGCVLFDRWAGLAAALVMAVAPFHVQYSQEIRMYSLMALLLALATWCFIRAWSTSDAALPDEPRWQRYRWWVAFGVFAGLAMYTQQLSALYLMAIGLVPLLSRRHDHLVGVFLGTAVAVIVYFPWLVNIPSQLEKVNSYYWVAQPTIGSLLLTIRSFLAINADMPGESGMLALLGALFVLLFLAVQTVMYLRRPRRRSDSDRDSLLFVLWLAVGPVVLMWLVSQIQPVYLERALLPAASMLYVALGWLFTRSEAPRPVLALVGVVALATAAVGLVQHYTLDTFPNSPFDDAAAFIRENGESEDVVIHMNKLTALPMVYYDRDLLQRYLADAPGSAEDTLALPTQESLNLLADACLPAAARDAGRIWFVVFERAEQQYEAAGRTELRDSFDWLDEHFDSAGTYTFNDLNVYLYDNPVGGFSTECDTP